MATLPGRYSLGEGAFTIISDQPETNDYRYEETDTNGEASTGSFRAMAERGELRYFLMPHPGALGRPGHRSSQERILGYVSRTWENVSLAAGLPPGSLYRYPGRQTEP